MSDAHDTSGGITATAAYMDRAALLRPHPRRYGLFDWPGGGVVCYRNLTELEKAKFENALTNEKGGFIEARYLDMRARLIASCLVDRPDGKLIFTKADVPAILEWDSAITAALFDAIRKHCGWDKDDLENLVKNSAETQPECSPSA